MDGEDLAKLHDETEAAADVLSAKAAEIHDLAKRLEDLAEGTPAWYAGTRARVEARAALEQAEELRRVLEQMGRELSGEVP
jgi:hypothetical protein